MNSDTELRQAAERIVETNDAITADIGPNPRETPQQILIADSVGVARAYTSLLSSIEGALADAGTVNANPADGDYAQSIRDLTAERDESCRQKLSLRKHIGFLEGTCNEQATRNLMAERDKLRQQVFAAERDAARWRWIESKSQSSSLHMDGTAFYRLPAIVKRAATLGAAVDIGIAADAAIAAEAKGWGRGQGE